MTVAERHARVRACGPPQIPGGSQATSTATSPSATSTAIIAGASPDTLLVNEVPSPPAVKTIVPRFVTVDAGRVIRRTAAAVATEGQLTMRRVHVLPAGDPAGHETSPPDA